MPRWVLVAAALTGCGDKVSSDDEAELAWEGLAGAVDRSLTLGMQGYSQASSANLDAQEDQGDVSGTIVVTGQADQGSSDNKGLRLDIALTDYADHVDLDDDGDDDIDIHYDTDPDAPPYADLKLRDLPAGSLSGTLTGDVAMDGDLEGVVTLALNISGPTESDGADGVRLVDGQTSVTGAVTNDDGGTYSVDVTD